MKITTKTTRVEMADYIKTLVSENEALRVTRDELRKVHTSANARIDQMGDNKPWKLAALAFVAGIVIGYFL